MALEVDATTSVNAAKNVDKNVGEAKMVELKWKISTPRAAYSKGILNEEKNMSHIYYLSRRYSFNDF